MRGLVLAVLGLISIAASAANPAPRAEPAAEVGNLSTIAGWLRTNGREGFIGADVADAIMDSALSTPSRDQRMNPPFLIASLRGQTRFAVYSSAILSSKKEVGLGAAMKRR